MNARRSGADDSEIDFHGLSAADAKARFDETVMPVLPVLGQVTIIVGRGKHSQAGVSVLRPVVLKRADHHGVQSEVSADGGSIIVRHGTGAARPANRSRAAGVEQQRGCEQQRRRRGSTAHDELGVTALASRLGVDAAKLADFSKKELKKVLQMVTRDGLTGEEAVSCIHERRAETERRRLEEAAEEAAEVRPEPGSGRRAASRGPSWR